MKIPLISDREVHIRFLVKFKTLEPLWELQTTPSQVRLSGVGGFSLAIPGRRPEEIEYMLLQYDEKEVKLYPEIDKDGEMKPITIYDGTRDYWTHALRQAALAAKPE